MTELTMAAILRLEDEPALLAIRCPATGIPLWTVIRSAFFRLIIGERLYGGAVVGAGGAAGALAHGSRLATAGAFARSFVHNALRPGVPRQDWPVLLMASGTRLTLRDGVYFNCLSDYFVGAAPHSTLAVEHLFEGRWPFPRAHGALLLHTPLRIDGVVRGRLRAAAYRDPARQLVALACERAERLLGWDIGATRRAWLEHYCANASASLLPRYRAYRSLFRRSAARLLIKEEACYGGADNASAVLAARHCGMVTAEYQHGAVSAGHDAYNYAPAVLADLAYRAIFPDYFLAYGAWWGEQMNAPVQVLPIGNPHRSHTLAAAPAVPRGNAVLVLGDGMDTGLYLALCQALAAALGAQAEVVFRPHPLERSAVAALHPDGRAGAVRIDGQSDIYRSFAAAQAVVSEVSTGLYEAIGLVPKVFVWDTPKARFTLGQHRFARFAGADDLIAQLRQGDAGLVSAEQASRVWAPDWERNYLEFLNSKGKPLMTTQTEGVAA